MMSQRNCALAVCGVNIITDRHGYKNGECFCPILHASETMSITEMPKQLIRTHTIGDRNGGTHTHTQRDDRSQNAWQSIRLGQDLYRQSTKNKKTYRDRVKDQTRLRTAGSVCWKCKCDAQYEMKHKSAGGQRRHWLNAYYSITFCVVSILEPKKKKIENNKWP